VWQRKGVLRLSVYDPWHYVPVLARKPGALRNGAPFKDWVLPAAMERVRRKLANADDDNRQMVDILTAVLADGLMPVEAARAEAIAHGVHPRGAGSWRTSCHRRRSRGANSLMVQSRKQSHPHLIAELLLQFSGVLHFLSRAVASINLSSSWTIT
jgi:hypothetical protein